MEYLGDTPHKDEFCNRFLVFPRISDISDWQQIAFFRNFSAKYREYFLSSSIETIWEL